MLFAAAFDADFDRPLQLSSDSAQQFVPDEGSVSMIESMGFNRQQAVAALKATVRMPFHTVHSRLESLGVYQQL